ncbi:MAG: hypothetical protein WC299_02960 [Kiritimatiellia bacterium]
MKAAGIIILLLFMHWNYQCSGEPKESPQSIQLPLAAAPQTPVFIEVEVRFIEADQDALERIGAQWMISDESGGPATNTASQEKRDKAGSKASSGNIPRFSMDPLSSSTILTDAELAHILPFIEQGNGVNLISAPKVVTQSGKNAENQGCSGSYISGRVYSAVGRAE